MSGFIRTHEFIVQKGKEEKRKEMSRGKQNSLLQYVLPL
jgi:hypothetical protein